MRRKLINLLLFALLIVIGGAIVVARRDYTNRNSNWLPGMFEYVAYNTQSSGMRAPGGTGGVVPGTVVRGFEPIPFKPTPEEAVRAGAVLKNPFGTDDTTLARGAQVFSNMCAPCHGAGGNGDGLIPLHGFPPPPSLFADNAMKMKDGQMFHAVTFGVRNMPSLAGQVLRADRWRAISYIRSLQAKKTVAAKK